MTPEAVESGGVTPDQAASGDLPDEPLGTCDGLTTTQALDPKERWFDAARLEDEARRRVENLVSALPSCVALGFALLPSHVVVLLLHTFLV